VRFGLSLSLTVAESPHEGYKPSSEAVGLCAATSLSYADANPFLKSSLVS